MKPKRRAARIVADDGEQKVLVTVAVLSRNGLVLDEVREIRTALARHIAHALEQMRYTDWGPENTKVTLLRRL